VGGENWGQGSSREHAAISPMYLGVKAILARSFARIHESNLVNFGIPPLRFKDPSDQKKIRQGDRLVIEDLRSSIDNGKEILVRNETKGETYRMTHALSKRQIEMLLIGGLGKYIQKKIKGE